jgi:hypothetical protein
MSACAICGGNPEFAVNCLLSTRRVRPRLQKCSISLLLCDSCLQGSQKDFGAELPLCLLEAVYGAYTEIKSRFGIQREVAR